LCFDNDPEYVKIAKDRLKDKTLPDSDPIEKDRPTKDTPPTKDDGDAKDVTVAENDVPEGEPPIENASPRRRPTRRAEPAGASQ